MGNGGGFREWLRYEWSCVKRAFTGGLLYAEGAAGFLTLALSPLSYFAPVDPQEWGSAMSWLPSAIFAAIFLGLIAYGIGISSFNDVIALRRKVSELEEKLRPKLRFGEPLMWTEPKDAVGRADVRTYRLRVHNDSAVQIEECSVRLIEMLNKAGRRTRHDSTCFRLKGDDVPPNMPTIEQSQSFDINPFDYRDVDIVEYAEIQGHGQVHMCYASRGIKSLNESRFVPSSLCPHQMTIRASAGNSNWIETRLSFYVDGEGILRAERVH